jgi:hypothetical protein
MLRVKHESKNAQSIGGRKGLAICTALVNITMIITRRRNWEGHVIREEK